MRITKICVSNFKSFKSAQVVLRPFNVIVGANAAGKTCFLQVFKFLKDTVVHGLDNAVSIQGGTEYLRNAQIGHSSPCVIEVSAEYAGVKPRPRPIFPAFLAHVTSFDWSFSIQFENKGPGYEVVDERIALNFVAKQDQTGTIIFRVEEGTLSVRSIQLETLTEDMTDALESLYVPIDSKSVALAQIPLWHPNLSKAFSDIMVFDIDPRLPKKAVPVTGKVQLEENGENLAIALKSVTDRRGFARMLQDLLPFVKDVDVINLADKSLLLQLKETHGPSFPAPFLSDGTIQVMALLLALQEPRAGLTIIEEPERNVHPSLLSRLVGVIRDVSREKQIILTTQSPEVVKHSGLENLLLVSRNADGFAEISYPSESKEVAEFLEKEIGIDELFAKRLLEGSRR